MFLNQRVLSFFGFQNVVQSASKFSFVELLRRTAFDVHVHQKHIAHARFRKRGGQILQQHCSHRRLCRNSSPPRASGCDRVCSPQNKQPAGSAILHKNDAADDCDSMRPLRPSSCAALSSGPFSRRGLAAVVIQKMMTVFGDVGNGDEQRQPQFGFDVRRTFHGTIPDQFNKKCQCQPPAKPAKATASTTFFKNFGRSRTGGDGD